MHETKKDPATAATIVIAIATVALVAVTLWYAYQNRALVAEARKQTSLARESYHRTLQPFLMYGQDSLSRMMDVNDDELHRMLSWYEYFYIENTGITYAEIVDFILHPLESDLSIVNIRDTLLLKDGPDLFHRPDTYEMLSNYIPAKTRISHNTKKYNIRYPTTNPPKSIYVHSLIIYRDTFNSYHDVYTVFRCDLLPAKRQVIAYPPKYNFHDYSQEEIQMILK